MWRVRLLVLGLLAPSVFVLGTGILPATPARAAADGLQPGPGQYYGARVRVLNNVSIAAGATTSVKVTGVGTVPAAGVSTVAVNIAAKGAGARGRVRIYPSELATPPTAETAFYRQGVWEDHLLMVQVGADGRLKLTNPDAGAVNVYLDIHGYVLGSAGETPGATYLPLPTSRVISNQPVPANGSATFTVTGLGGVPATQVAFVAFTLVVKGTANSKVTAYPSGAAKPVGSNLDYRSPDHMSNLAIVAPGTDGKITIHNEGTAGINVWADVAGYFATARATVAGSAAMPVSPRRLVSDVTVPANGTYTVAPLGQLGVPGSGVTGVGVTITVTGTAAGLLRVYPTGQTAVPTGGSIAYQPGDSWNSFVPVRLGADGKFVIANRGSAAVTLTVSTFQYFKAPDRPASPAGVAARPGDGRATVSWVAAPDGGAAITGYRVVADPGGATATATAEQREATVTGLANGTSYTFQVTASNAVGASDPSPGSYPVVAGRPPGVPANVMATAADGVARVGWQAPNDPGTSPITGYTVTELGSRRTVTTTGETSAVFIGLANGSAYTFAVVARNETGDSAASAPSNAVTPQPLPTAGRPLIADVRPRDGAVELSWAPPDTGADAVTLYRLVAQPGGRSVETPSDVRTATITGLANGTTYTFTVTAVNANGAGPVSLPAQAIPRPAQPPLAPTVTQVRPANGRIEVTWLAAGDGGSAITGYRLSAEPGAATVTLAGDATTGALTGLINATAYTVTLVAVNAAGTSSATTTANVTPVAQRVPQPPGDVTAAAVGSGRVTVGWAPPADPGTSPITSYTITAQPGGRSVSTTGCAADAPACSATIDGLDPAVAYTFTVAAQSAHGAGAASPGTGAVLPRFVPKVQAWELTAAAARTLVAAPEDGRLVFHNPPPEVTDLTAGRYVVIPATEASPQGMVRKITRVATSGPRTVLSTVDASLGDLIADGEFTGQISLDAADVGEPGTLNTGASAGELRGRPIPLHIQAAVGSHGRVSADLALTPKLTYHLRMRAGKLSGSVTVASEVVGHVVTRTSHGEDWSREFDLGRWTFTKGIHIGGVTVPVVLTTTLTARAEASASGAVTLEGFPAIEAGIAAEIDGWRASWSPLLENHSVASPPQIDGAASARFEVAVDQSVTMARLLGVGGRLTPYLSTRADVNADPWWWVRAGAVLSGCVVVLDECTPAAGSIDRYITLRSASGPFRGISVTPARATMRSGQSVDFDVRTHNAPAGPVRWEVVEGPGTINSDGVYTSPVAGRAVVRATRLDGGVDDPTDDGVVEVDPPLPPAPVDVVATPGPLSAHVSWQPPPNNLVGITGYVVVATPLARGVPERVEYAGAGERTVSIRDLRPGRAYEIRVRAHTSAGTGRASAAVRVTPSPGILPDGEAVNVAVDANGRPDNSRYAGWSRPRLSGDGRYAFFLTISSSNLMPPEAFDPNGSATYLLRKDIYSGELKLVSRGPDGHTPAPVDMEGQQFLPSWDGSRVAYVTFPVGGSPYRATDLIVQDIDGNDDWLAVDGNDAVAPTCVCGMSSDGDIVLYGLENSSSRRADLIRLERGQPARVIAPGADPGRGHAPALSADGAIVAYGITDGPDGGAPTNEHFRDRVIVLDTAVNRRVTVAQSVRRGEPRYSSLGGPVVSPDGSMIGYHTNTFDPTLPVTGMAFVAKLEVVRQGAVVKLETGTPRPVDRADYTTAMSAHGRAVGYGRWGSAWGPYSGGIFDVDADAGVASAGVITDLSYDGSAALYAFLCNPNTTTCTNGVWLQRYDTPGRRGSVARCNEPDYGYISEEYQRRTGIRVKLCHPIRTGSGALPGIRPPGWPPDNSDGRYARGHLLAAQLGGSGRDPRNLVTMFQDANNRLMKPEEMKVASAVMTGEDIYYYATPVYSDSYEDKNDRMPDKIHIVARGESGFFLDVCIPNREGATQTYNDPCTA